ncbi:hypothetical protein ACFP4H_17680 [Pseudophaeobacter arcticus]|uniref:hypothetical protein n=1 Tax=Pseudophaeobacter arcticus TaxID=385492 RepID=UPI0004840D12|nr:hypothetical protein [Pseudophaeobacter arcticus]
MSDRVAKFSDELNELIAEGELLCLSLEYVYHPNEVHDAYLKSFDGDEPRLDKFLDSLPSFLSSYQSWYSKAQAVVKQVLPDRLDDFNSHFEYPRVRKAITYDNYMIKDCLQDLRVTKATGAVVNGAAAIPEFRQQLYIAKAARDALKSKLVDLTAVLQADLFDSEVEAAASLGKAGHLRAAGAVCGVVIEKHLHHVCDVHSITIRKKNPGISDLNELLKGAAIIAVPQWRFIQYLGDIRNVCDHAKGREPTKEEIEDLVVGTAKVLKTIY